jgi:outer membrane protein assembly factor BamE
VTKVLSLGREQTKWLILRESVATKSTKIEVNDAAPTVEVFKLRDVTADEKSEVMPEKMMQESAIKALEPAPKAKPVVKPVEPVKSPPVPAKIEPAKVEVKVEASKVESNKDKPLPPEDGPGYFERMLEKIGF